MMLSLYITVAFCISAAIQSITPEQGFTGTSCPNTQMTCMDGSCVDISDVCDFTPDCSDGGDEKGCPLTCGFDRDFCGWTNTHPDKLNWERGSGASTINMRTMAPQYDSTSNLNGYYVFIHDQTGGRPSGNQAVLTSPTYNSASAQCNVQFHYFMQGPSVGTLRLTVTQAGKKAALWQDQGDHGSNWQSTTVGIGRRNTGFTLAFEKANSYTYHGAIAVDQLQFQDCGRPQPQQSCNSVTQFTCVNKACVSLTRKCDITDDCEDHSDEGDPSCKAYKRFDFEQDFGDLTQGNNGVDDNFDWVRWNGSTPTINTGPDRDHSTGLASGHYLYMEASAPQKYNQKTWLLTKPFKATIGKSCHMRFYYYMYGKFVNQLNIYSRIYNSGTPTNLAWSVAGNQGAVWQRADISLNNSNSFQVIIEGKIGDSYIGDIAIDDVSFTPDCQYSGQSLPTPPVVVSASTLTPPTTAPHTCDLTVQYNCHSTGKCINKIKQCDFRKDCSDGSDEDSCVHATTTFEGGDMGNWQINQSQSSTDMTYNWLVTQASSSSGDQYRPTTDHTNTAATTGWFLWADSSPGKYKDTAVLYTPLIGQTGPQCTLKFFYYMNGVTGALEVYMKYKQSMQQLWLASGENGTVWNEADIFIGPAQHVQIVVQAKRGPSYSGDITLDDVYFLNCQPPTVALAGCYKSMFTCSNGYCIDPTKQCNYANDCGDSSDEVKSQCDVIYPGRCNFEYFMCSSWTQEVTDDFDWTIHQGQTPSPGTGPSVDHTTRSIRGNYLYIESSAPRVQGDKARLASFAIKGSSNNCAVRLWYNMNGADVGQLNIYKRFNYTASGLAPIISFSSNGGDVWTETQNILDGKGGAGDYMVVIEATCGNGYYGDIAIDDVSLTPDCESGGFIPGQPTAPPTTPGTCRENQLTCKNGNCYSHFQQCDFYDNCGDQTDESSCGTSCTFESGLCGWQNNKGDKFYWTINSGKTTSDNTGPANDHTLRNRNGHYLYMETSGNVQKGDNAILVSSEYSQTGPNCKLTFWYNMYGRSIGSLRVFAKTAQDGIVYLWSKSGNQANEWYQGTVALGARRKFAILFEATKGNGYEGDIAIDDVRFHNCNVGTVAQSCSDTQFMCANHIECVDLSYKCDKAPDCRDGSDEFSTNCPRHVGDCSFDTTSWLSDCKWTQLKSDEGNWYQAATSNKTGTGPLTDHSRTATGKYLFMDSSRMQVGDIDSVATPSFPPSAELCQLRFYYNMRGSPNMGPLNVYIENSQHQRQLVWTRSNNQGPGWQRVNIPIGNTQGFRVVFEAERGTGPLGDIALDDVTFTPECTLGSQTVTPVKKTLPPTTKSASVTAGTNLCPDGQFMCTDRQCITARVLCDGVHDCSDGSDENQCGVPCEENSFYCQTKGICMAKSEMCNTICDCPLHVGDQFGQDESSCSRCPYNYCLNGGRCTVKHNNMGPVCNCSNGYSGWRCQISNGKPDSTQVTTRSSTGSPKTDFRQAVHVQCLHQGWFVSVELSKLSPQPSYVTDINMGTETCIGIVQGDRLVFNQMFDKCNTHAQVTDVKMTFTNKLLYVPELNHAIDDIGWEYNMQCSRSRYANATVQIIQTGNVTKQGSSGSIIDISVFKDANFREPLQGITEPGPTMYVQVVALTPLDVVMVLDSCEASVQAPNTSEQKSISLIEKHCSVDQTTNILIVRSEVIRFQFDLVYPSRDMEGISITCDVHFCDQSDLSHTCDQTCRVNPAVIG